MKRYRLGVSRHFPATHLRKGEPTFFVEKIRHSTCKYLDLEGNRIQMCCNNCDDKFECNIDKKLHTIRKNYPLWENRMKEVQEGKAVIELFYWSGKPYRSKQIVFATLDKDSECGIQKLTFNKGDQNTHLLIYPLIDDMYYVEDIQLIRKNDGLSWQDFKDWFNKYDLSKEFAIIQFTSYRY